MLECQKLSIRKNQMSIQLSINTILRQNDVTDIKIGKEYSFSKNSTRFMTNNMPIWLTKEDWTPIAEISITSQTIKEGHTSGTYIVNYIYSNEEASVLKKIFVRMYGELF